MWSIVTSLKNWFDRMRRRFYGFPSAGGTVITPPPPPPPPPPAAPVKTGNPTISSPTLNVGDTATAVHGTYTGTVTSYSGQWYRGASPIALATALTYAFVSADLGLNITYQESASNAGGSSATGTSNALGPIVSAPALATPTLAIQSTLGAAPLVLSVSDTDDAMGLFGWLQIDQTSNAFANITQNILFFIDASNIANLDQAIGLATPAGAYWARFSVARDNDSGATTVTGNEWNGQAFNAVSFTADVSNWSNVVTDTIISSAAVLNTTNGVNKNSTLTVSGSPALSFSGLSGNGPTSARTTIEQVSSKAQFELTVTSGATTDFAVGIDNGTANLSGTVSPGYNDSTGINVEFNNGGASIQINWNARGNSTFVVNNVAGTVANGDIFTIVYDDSSHTLEVWRTRSGTTVQLGSTASGLPTLTHRYAFASTINATMAGTLNFGGTTYAKTPGSGVAAIWA